MQFVWVTICEYTERKKSGKSYIKILIMVISGGGIIFMCFFVFSADFFCLCVLHMELKHNKSYL